MPVGTNLAFVSPILIPQGRWITGDQFDSGHLLWIDVKLENHEIFRKQFGLFGLGCCADNYAATDYFFHRHNQDERGVTPHSSTQSVCEGHELTSNIKIRTKHPHIHGHLQHLFRNAQVFRFKSSIIQTLLNILERESMHLNLHSSFDRPTTILDR